jgi:hypothetical protein
MTDSGSETSHIQVTQLAGPGVPGMEDDIPLYHFDVSAEEMQELIADPDGFLSAWDSDPTKTVNMAR